MVDRLLINSLDVSDAAIDAEITSAFGGEFSDALYDQAVAGSVGTFTPNAIIKGRVINLVGDDVILDIGLKSEGVVAINEWDDPSHIDIGDEVDLLLETVESDTGTIIVSKRKADRILNWQRIVETAHEGDVVKGAVTRKIKGGLLVDIGVPVFLPASQVDIRRPGDVSDLIGQTIEAKILKIDKERRNIVISRRKLIEETRAAAKQKLMGELVVGQLRKGVVKNIADFGAFIDLGGIDGLLHITDMSWDRIGHPSEMLKIDQDVEVKVLTIDREREKIALGLKQKEQNPWEKASQLYPPGTRVTGEVVNIMNYGAFVKIEAGVEGLVHISEMSWTRRINHPSELVKVGDKIEVVVLDINKEKEEISLGMKQTEVNPWTTVAQRYPPGTVIEGKVRNLASYGAFIEIEEGIDGLLHVSDISWTKKVSHPSEVLKKGDVVRCVVLSVDQEKMRVALGLKQMTEDPWIRAVPDRYQPGMVVRGKVTKITNFGVFVELEPDLEGLLHVSELADHKVENPQDEVNIGDEIDVKILRVDTGERKIGLSKKRADWAGVGDEPVEPGSDAAKPKKEKKRRGGLHAGGEIAMDAINDVLFKKDDE
ncbi:MAG: 30S ribosomal protein S1 [Phycisphaerae bacterium]|nr:30S ribosomal protein S1 [Phycisphaerae bacterium]